MSPLCRKNYQVKTRSRFQRNGEFIRLQLTTYKETARTDSLPSTASQHDARKELTATPQTLKDESRDSKKSSLVKDLGLSRRERWKEPLHLRSSFLRRRLPTLTES